ncbi:uncharacterized protein EI97DRAFT_173931 [Westerdykella ornata]|uniref:Uncharacterized protein n=1 Tax=Westerdykella ornata TaxID=318751 RepID=A0A6A6JWC4_WESOR|nr:uncharacterized protein EI97DRAFT_173931 [Westerdykella ornata]KAF2279369.1 hypothetical protein EI97DRAFT_173931 [Westerdykella ornata]
MPNSPRLCRGPATAALVRRLGSHGQVLPSTDQPQTRPAALPGLDVLTSYPWGTGHEWSTTQGKSRFRSIIKQGRRWDWGPRSSPGPWQTSLVGKSSQGSFSPRIYLLVPPQTFNRLRLPSHSHRAPFAGIEACFGVSPFTVQLQLLLIRI